VEDFLCGHDRSTVWPGDDKKVAFINAGDPGRACKPATSIPDMSALDRRTRERMQMELARIRKLTKTTIIQITYHFDDVFDHNDRIAIMREGRIIQSG